MYYLLWDTGDESPVYHTEQQMLTDRPDMVFVERGETGSLYESKEDKTRAVFVRLTHWEVVALNL